MTATDFLDTTELKAAFQRHNRHELTEAIRTLAYSLGFQKVGFCDAEPLTDAGEKLNQWIAADRHGSMDWMARTARQRADPRAFFPQAQSVIVVALNYYQEAEPESAQVHYARYAQGRDYHKVLKKKLKKLAAALQEALPDTTTRACVDSFPLMEKPLAVKAGLGWIGKNTNLLIKQQGSWFFLGELLTSLSLVPDTPVALDHCGTCTACLQACPTDALFEPFQLDATQCIAYLTIERKGPMPPELADKLADWIFGCDICQEVCPWNRFSTTTQEEDFRSRIKDEARLLSYLQELSEDTFHTIFAGTPIRRAGYKKFMESLHYIVTHQNQI